MTTTFDITLDNAYGCVVAEGSVVETTDVTTHRWWFNVTDDAECIFISEVVQHQDTRHYVDKSDASVPQHVGTELLDNGANSVVGPDGEVLYS